MGLTVEDRLALQDLMARYAYAIDVGCSEEEFLALFTEDVVMVSPLTGQYQGIEGIKKFRAERVPRWGKTQVRHIITNFLIDHGVEDDRATLKAYLCQFKTQLELPLDTKPKTEFVFAGNYDCVARKINGKWKLERRSVYIDDLSQVKQDLVDSLLPGRSKS